MADLTFQPPQRVLGSKEQHVTELPSTSEVLAQSKPVTEHIAQFFEYSHLPPHLREVSKPFCDLAFAIIGDSRGMPEGTSTQFPIARNPERTVALRKLLEAKDAAVRAALAK
jgi:hypothetical protein